MPTGLLTTGGRVARLCGRVQAAAVDGPRTNSRTQVALCGDPYAAIQLAMGQDQAVVAASLELVVETAARTALDGVMSQLQIAQHALAASILLQVLQCALAMEALLVVGVAVANGVLTVAVAAMMVQAGATSPAPIVRHVQEHLTTVLLRQGAGECSQARV